MTAPILNPQTLHQMKTARKVDRPSYPLSLRRAGIVHIGPGNFPLAHMAYKTHQVMQEWNMADFDYGIRLVSLMTPKRRDQINAQGGLYTVTEQEPSGKNKMTIVGSVIDALFAPEDPQAVIDAIAAPTTKIVSMTITPQSHQAYMTPQGDLNLAHPHIVHDLDRNAKPQTVLGYLARGLNMRKADYAPGLTVMNLDNMEHNGEVIGRMVRQFAQAFDPSLVGYIDRNVTFPNSMVDRIVPKTTPENVSAVERRLGIKDSVAIPAEPMPSVSWVIEDNFAQGRPAWEKAGALFVPDVLPYEKLKLRLLNASHLAIACVGDLAGYTYIDEAMADDKIKGLMLNLMDRETGLTVDPVPGVDVAAYKAELIERFANTAIKDTTQRVATDAPLQVALDCARDRLKDGGSVDLLALTVAAWIRRFTAPANEKGGAIKVVHPEYALLKERADAGGTDPRSVMAVASVFGDLGEDPAFVGAVGRSLRTIVEKGVMAATSEALAAAGKRSGVTHDLTTSSASPTAELKK